MATRFASDPRHLTMLGGALTFVLVLGAAGDFVGRQYEEGRQAQEIQRSVEARAGLLRSEVERHRLLPETLAGNPLLASALGAAENEALRRQRATDLSLRFERLAALDGSATLYLIGRDGVTAASSNHRSTTSFVGQNYAFRPYFQQAMSRGAGEHFAQGTVSGVPGLYLAQRLDDGSGVVVVKVEFGALEKAWAVAGDTTFVVDKSGTVLLTTLPVARFKPLTALRETSVARLARGPVGHSDWTLIVARDTRAAMLASRLVGGTTGVSLGALCSLAFAMAWVSRTRRDRTRNELERLVAERTDQLEASNARLLLEIDERARLNARAEQLRHNLEQANRLAVLGQISAGVAHEINQPVAAIRTNVDTARTLLERGRAGDAAGNLATIAALTERIGLITDELRSFSRKSPAVLERVRLADAVEGARLLLDPLYRSRGIRLDRAGEAAEPVVLANRTRLEQVIVNLLRNAAEALEDTVHPVVTIQHGCDDQGCWLAISDNGPGVPDERVAELFLPFSTTKDLGLGLGLVISRDIVADFGGSLRYEPGPSGGASFVMRFPKASAP